MKMMGRKLNPDECRLIGLIMGEKGKTQRHVGEAIGVDRSQVSRKIRGYTALTYKQADDLYVFFGKDERLKFLIQPTRDDPRKEKWEHLFASYVDPLKQNYLNQSFEVKARILQDLETLAAKYVQTNLQNSPISQ